MKCFSGRRIGCSYADPSACFCRRNCREVSGRRIGYSQAEACSYADPARPLCGETGIEVRSTRGAAIENKYRSPRNQRTIQESGLSCKKQTGAKRLFLLEKRPGRRIGYSQAEACSYADPAGPLCKNTKCKRAPLRGDFYWATGFSENIFPYPVATIKKSLPESRDSSRLHFVGETGFEPATSNSRSWRANRTALHPEQYTPLKFKSAQRYDEKLKRQNKIRKNKPPACYSFL